MGRCLICLIGPVLAAIFAIAMYALYGNVNWGSPAFEANRWIEPVFWALMASGVVALALGDMFRTLGNWFGGSSRSRETQHGLRH